MKKSIAIAAAAIGATPNQSDPWKGSKMRRKIIPTITAAAMSMSFALAAPVGVTVVSSLTVAPEAQAWGLKKIKRVAKRKYKKAKRKYNNTKRLITGKKCPGGSWINGRHGLCGMTVNPIPRIPKGRIGDPVPGTRKASVRRRFRRR